MADQELALLFTLYKIPAIGPKTARRLIDSFGDLDALFSASLKKLMAIPGVGYTTAKKITSAQVNQGSNYLRHFRQKYASIQIIPYYHARYPRRLAVYNDAPLFLFFAGNQDLNAERMISIVGTRNPSEHGTEWLQKCIEQLSGYTLCIISGLAHGIDTIVHRSCVQNNVATLGVLGHGLDRIYPAENVKLANKMIQQGGLLSEFMPMEAPKREHFPMRNRIIAAMADAVLVVESKEKGGSMITAQFANEYYKEVFAVPGRPSDTRSAGCNLLIKNHQAHMVTQAKDIIDLMNWEEANTPPKQKHLFYDASEEEAHVIACIRKEPGIGVDAIQNETGFRSANLSLLLLNLEFHSIIKSLPGKRYILA